MPYLTLQSYFKPTPIHTCSLVFKVSCRMSILEGISLWSACTLSTRSHQLQEPDCIIFIQVLPQKKSTVWHRCSSASPEHLSFEKAPREIAINGRATFSQYSKYYLLPLLLLLLWLVATLFGFSQRFYLCVVWTWKPTRSFLCRFEPRSELQVQRAIVTY